MSTPTKTWRGSTLDTRASERRDQLVEAAVELLGTQGGTALTMRAACRTARLSPRYFYESFANRDELARAAYDATVHRMATAVTEAFHGDADRLALLRAGLDAAAALIEDDPRVGRILFRESIADNALRPHALATLPGFFAGALGQVLAADHRWFQFRLSAVTGAGVSLFTDWTEGRLEIDRRTFVDYCADLLDTMLGQP